MAGDDDARLQPTSPHTYIPTQPPVFKQTNKRNRSLSSIPATPRAPPPLWTGFGRWEGCSGAWWRSTSCWVRGIGIGCVCVLGGYRTHASTNTSHHKTLLSPHPPSPYRASGRRAVEGLRRAVRHPAQPPPPALRAGLPLRGTFFCVVWTSTDDGVGSRC